MSAVPPQRGNGLLAGQINPIESQTEALVHARTLSLQPREERTYPHSLAQGVELDVDAEIRPGESIIVFRDGVPESRRERLIESFGAVDVLASPSGHYLLRRAVDPNLENLALLSRQEVARLRTETLEGVEFLNSLPEVRLAEPNYVLRPNLAPSDELYPSQWHLRLSPIHRVIVRAW